MPPRPLEPILRPKSLAVVGASARPKTIGHEILRQILDYPFAGAVYPVNPKAEEILGTRCFKDVSSLPDTPDLAVITVPQSVVIPSVKECIDKGVRGLVVITAGFKEIGEGGAKLERELADIVSDAGVPMIGPNCYGVVNTNPSLLLDATFGRVHPLRGKVGFITQSGALGQIIMEYAHSYRVGFSQMVSVGNKADVSDVDVLDAWADDYEVEIILLYMESIDDPRAFAQSAAKITPVKPIIAVKAGRSEAGAKATASHTGALAGSDTAVDALFERCGVLRANSLEQMFDWAIAFASQSPPKGKRVAVMTNAGGPAIMATDAVEGKGLTVARFDKATESAMREVLPSVAATGNPVDMIASATPEQYDVCMKAVLDDTNVDALLCIYIPPIMTDHLAVADRIAARANETDKTVVAVFMGIEDPEADVPKVLSESGVPTYMFPESAADSLAAMTRYERIRSRGDDEIARFDDIDSKVAKAIVSRAVGAGEKAIVGEDALRLLSAYGIPVAKMRTASSVEDAATKAREIGGSVAIKLTSPPILHKTELGGVALDLANEDEVRDAAERMKRIADERDASAPFEVLIQEMVAGGTETVLGVVRDPAYGPQVMFGLGGIAVEVLRDVQFRLVPLPVREAREMIESVRGLPLLTGARGRTPADLDFLAECLCRISALASDFDEIDEVDINPFMAGLKSESVAVDVRVILKYLS
jgi:acetyl coenzyme A synthetase (ADP forming)-like protein